MNAALQLTTETAAKPQAKKKAQTKKLPKPQPTLLYAQSGVILMSVLSALLNGYAHAEKSPVAWAGWGMGLIIPVIVLIIGKVSTDAFKRKRKRLAVFMAVTGIGLLVLSVWHCASSIATLTGSPIFLSVPMAIAIDCGLIGCEIATILE